MDVLTDQGPDTGAVIRERKVREAPRKSWGLGVSAPYAADFWILGPRFLQSLKNDWSWTNYTEEISKIGAVSCESGDLKHWIHGTRLRSRALISSLCPLLGTQSSTAIPQGLEAHGPMVPWSQVTTGRPFHGLMGGRAQLPNLRHILSQDWAVTPNRCQR